jgi:hypothetical protein
MLEVSELEAERGKDFRGSHFGAQYRIENPLASWKSFWGHGALHDCWLYR